MPYLQLWHDKMKTIQLFCVPYSGGSATIYEKWKVFLNENIELCPVEMAGRGKRIMEPLNDRFDETIEDLADSILKHRKKNMDYAIWGHSLGALFAYEIYYRMREKGGKPPVAMFFSGRGAPQEVVMHTQYHLLGNKEFLEVVCQYGGSTKEIMQHEELRDLFLPILRNDFKLSETYIYKAKKQKIICDVHIINGTEDHSVKDYDMKNWAVHTDRECLFKMITGGHFFISENIKDTTDYINEVI